MSAGVPPIAASVIVPSNRLNDSLRRTLKGLESLAADTPTFEVVLVNNSPAPLTNPDPLPPLFRWVHAPDPGLHEARHTGALAARGQILVYIDDDVDVPANWLKAMLQPFEDPHVAAVAGKVEPRFSQEPPSWVRGLDSGYLSLLDLGDSPRLLAETESPYGCNMAVRREALFRLGGFNPDGFPNGPLLWLRGDGEVGLARKIHASGQGIAYAPAAKLFHRIEVDRLTGEYLEHRSYRQGLSDSYADYRYRERSLFGTLSHGVAGLACAWVGRLLARGDEAARKKRLDVAYFAGRLAHNLQLWRSASLRAHARRASYLPPSPAVPAPSPGLGANARA